MSQTFVRIRGDSNKYPQHMFLGVNKGKKSFYHLSYWYILGFFLVAEVFNAESWVVVVVITGVLSLSLSIYIYNHPVR